MIDISKTNKAKILMILYNNSKPQGSGFLHFDPTPMLETEAEMLLMKHQYFDYLRGRVMKIDLSKDQLDTRLYNRDNGPNHAEKVLKKAGLI